MAEKNENRVSFFSSDTFKGLLPFVGLIVILVVMYYLTDGRIMQPKRLRLLLSQVYYPMIVAVGVFFIMTLGSIDFTEGSTLGVASIVISVLSFYSIPLAVIGGIVTGALIGAVNGFFHVKFKLQSFIVTICTMYLFRGVCAYLTTETAIPASKALKALDSDNLKIAITLVVLIVAYFLFRFTRIGNDVKAIGSGETAARFSGVRTVNVLKVGSITSTAGNQLETQILISLVLGGLPITGGAKVRFSNIIVGTLMYTVLNNGLVMLGLESATHTIDRKALKVIK